MAEHQGKGTKKHSNRRERIESSQANKPEQFTSDFSKAQKNQHNFKEFFQ